MALVRDTLVYTCFGVSRTLAVLCIHSPHIASPPGAASPAPRACRLRLKLVVFVSLASSHSKHGLPSHRHRHQTPCLAKVHQNATRKKRKGLRATDASAGRIRVSARVEHRSLLDVPPPGHGEGVAAKLEAPRQRTRRPGRVVTPMVLLPAMNKGSRSA